MPNTYTLPTDPADCQGAIVAPGMPCATFNVCIMGIDARIFRMTQEMTKNVSSRVTGFSADDKARIDAAYAELVEFADLAGGSIMDFHGLVQWPLSDISSVQAPVENETVNAALSYLWGADYNLRISQSARLNDGILETDLNDLQVAITKSKALVDAFYGSFNPMDMPQSNPRQAVVSPAHSS